MKKKPPHPDRTFDVLSALVTFDRRKDRVVPLLKLQDVLRDKPKATSLH